MDLALCPSCDRPEEAHGPDCPHTPSPAFATYRRCVLTRERLKAEGYMVAAVRTTTAADGKVTAVFHMTPAQWRELRAHPEKYPKGIVGVDAPDPAVTPRSN